MSVNGAAPLLVHVGVKGATNDAHLDTVVALVYEILEVSPAFFDCDGFIAIARPGHAQCKDKNQANNCSESHWVFPFLKHLVFLTFDDCGLVFVIPVVGIAREMVDIENRVVNFAVTVAI